MAAEKAAGIAVAVATGLPAILSSFSNSVTVPVLGVAATSVLGAALGTLGALGYDDNPPRPGGRLAMRAASTIIIASMLVGGVPALTGWHWDVPAAEGAVAGLTAVAWWYLFDPVKKLVLGQLPELRLVDLIPFIRRRNAGSQPPVQNAPTDDKGPTP